MTTRSNRRLSLIQPTGHLTLGNLLGALRPMREATAHGECFYGVCDLHALTMSHDPERLRAQTREVCGL
ncbi:MAG: tryptophan--tRNA ligase, partial [Nocardioidaceae bacterium]